MNDATLTTDQYRQAGMLRADGFPESLITAIFAPPGNADVASKEAARLRRINSDKYEPLTDEEFQTIAAFVPEAAQARTPLRSFLDGVLWTLENNKPWSAVPARFGDPDPIRQRFSRMASKSDGLTSLADRVRGSLTVDRQREIEKLSAYASKIAERRLRARK